MHRSLIAAASLLLALAIGSASTQASRRDQQAQPPSSGKPQPSQPSRAPAAPPSAATYVGDKACIECHDTEGESYHKTIHAKAQNPRTPAAAHGCETCHGPGSVHAEDPSIPGSIRRFKAMQPRDVSDTCLTCHSRGTHAFWKGSQHDSRNLSCISCHSVHEPKSPEAQLKAASELELCATCHRQESMKIRRASHMPLPEGKMTCSSCHNPHGSQNVRQLRTGNWINEACISCHAEKRGPFLWEHAPGRDSCVNCHDPHGSSNDRMLVAKLPMLCQRCHIGTRHPSTIYDFNNVAPGAASPSNRIYGRGCVNCHVNIHGSNHPSGNAFLR